MFRTAPTRPLPPQPPSPGRPDFLCADIVRLTAPNPGLMTGPGTNSYLLGDAQHGYVVLDPGPDLAAHTDALWQHSADAGGQGGFIHAIVCTHSHADHAPGAVPLQRRCAAAGRPVPPVWGLPSGPFARPASQFTPDRVAPHAAPLPLPAGLPPMLFVHTPGHAANHLCLLLPAHGVVLSGDHVLQGSTTVIDPPDGHMGDYLASLALLAGLCSEHNIHSILPAHGGVIEQPVQTIEALLRHRQAREAKVWAAMQAQPQGSAESWLPLAYADVPPALWPVAMRSLLAHVAHLQTLHGTPTLPSHRP